MPGPMDRLTFLVGHWEGVGRHRRADGSWSRLHQTEDVRFAMGGALLVVEGLGRRLDDLSAAAGDGPGDVVHQAFAVASHEPDGDTFRWEAFIPGHRTEAVLEVTENGFAWSMAPAPGVRTDLRATVADGTWTETATMHRPGAGPQDVLEMTLHRVAVGSHLGA